MKKSENNYHNSIQMHIDAMIVGESEAIVAGAESDVPLLQINAIIQGTKHKIKDRAYLKAIENLCSSKTAILNVSIAECAKAACDVLNYIPYQGKEKHILEIIKAMKNGTIY